MSILKLISYFRHIILGILELLLIYFPQSIAQTVFFFIKKLWNCLTIFKNKVSHKWVKQSIIYLQYYNSVHLLKFIRFWDIYIL